METFSEIALILFGIIVFIRVREGDAATWFKAKFFNAAAPAPEGPARLRSVGGAAGGGTISVGGWGAPADGPTVSGFGPRKSPGGIGSTNHQGLDIDGRTGDPIRASRSGRVTYAGNAGGYGLKVDIDHGDGWTSRYAHMSRIEVRVGQDVRAGERLGAMGATGKVTGDHLHFEIRRNGVAVDAAPYLSGAASPTSPTPTRTRGVA